MTAHCPLVEISISSIIIPMHTKYIDNNYFMGTLRYLISITALCLTVLTQGDVSEAQFPSVREDLVQARIISSLQTNRQNLVGEIGVLFTIKPGWHIYWKNSGESALPTKLEFSTPNHLSIAELQWPVPKRFEEAGDITTYGYTDKVALYSEVEGDRGLDDISISANIELLVCNDICIPWRKLLRKTISLAKQSEADANLIDKFKHTSTGPKAGSLSRGWKTNSNQIVVALKHSALSGINSFDIFPSLPTGNAFKSTSIWKITDEFSKENFLDTFQLVITTSLSAESSSEITEDLSGIVVAYSDKNLEQIPWSIKLRDKTIDFDISKLEENPAQTSIPVTSQAKKKKPVEQSTKPSHTSLFTALLFALIGGIILNFMPCVLPVVSIKVLSLVELKNKTRAESIKSALAYSFGITLSMLIIAFMVIILTNAGKTVGWGFQFQNPIFVFALLIIIATLALNYFDFYSLPSFSFTSNNDQNKQNSLLKDVFDGGLVTALATPCTAPFLGTALAFAFSQSPLNIIAIFLTIGVGISAPFLLISLSSKFVSLIPQPGSWMKSFRTFMGFLLLATGTWLLFVLHSLVGAGAISAVASLLSIAFAIWLLKLAKKSGKIIKTLAWVIAILAISYYAKSALNSFKTRPINELHNKEINWSRFSEEALVFANKDSKAVFIDFTADWCITCKANESLIIETTDVSQAIKDCEITPLKADWTSGDEVVTQALKRYNGTGVPHYVIISENGQAVESISQLPSKNSLINAFQKASSKC